MEAIVSFCNKNNKDEFYKLITIQRKDTTRPSTIKFGKHEANSETKSWRNYFKSLATLQDNSV